MKYAFGKTDELKDRTFTIRLSDNDCDELTKLCGRYGIKVTDILENFLYDLVSENHYNGSDERNLADEYFHRCWIGMFETETLLNYLIDHGYDPEDYIEKLDDIATAKKEKEYSKTHLDEFTQEELEFLDSDLEDWKNELKEMLDFWKPKNTPNMEVENEIIKQWIEEKKNLLGENE